MEEAKEQQEQAPPSISLCKNCQNDVGSLTYCPVCGQKSDTHVLKFRELLAELADGLFNLDSRLWRSLIPLVAHPGKLTNEYLSGRRMHYLPPFRLYLILSIIFFLIPDNDFSFNEDVGEIIGAGENAQTSPPDENLEAEDVLLEDSCSFDGLPQHSFYTALMRDACTTFAENPEQLTSALSESIPVMMILGIPLVALFMKLIYPFSGRYYVEHVIFLFHVHAFYFFVSILMAISSLLGQAYPVLFAPMDWLRIIAGFYIPVYIFLAMRKVYRGTKLATFFKAFLILVGYGFSVSVVMSIGMLYTALTF